MKTAQIAALTFQFHRALYVSLTQKCPIRCRHCFVESGPTRKEHASLADYRKWIDQIASAKNLELVVFSGGEPFSHPIALRYGLDVCAQADCYSIVSTSGYWAKSRSSADELLSSFSGVRCLWLSTDVYHEEFVPLRFLRNATESAASLNIDVAFQIVDDAPDDSQFIDKFEREVGFDLVGPDQIYITPLTMVGRAAKELGSEGTTSDADVEQVPDIPCVWLGTPWLHENGVLCACPNLDVLQRRNHPLQIGNLTHDDFESVSAQANTDLYIQALRVFGPRWVVENLPVERWGWERSEFRGQTICDLCHSLAATPELPNQLRRELAGSPAIRRQIDVLRYLMYAETLEILSGSRLEGVAGG